MKELIMELTESQKEILAGCETKDELLAFIDREGLELTVYTSPVVPVQICIP